MTNTTWAYSEKVKEHFFNPKNVLIEDESLYPYDARGLSGNKICGDQMLMLLQIEDDIITDVRWKTYGCASAIASTSMLSVVVKGMNIYDAFKVTPQEVSDKLGGLPPNKKHCSVMGDEALQNAINNYLVNAGREQISIPKTRKIICKKKETIK